MQILPGSWGFLTGRECQQHLPCPEPVIPDTAELSPPWGHQAVPRLLLAAPERGWFPPLCSVYKSSSFDELCRAPGSIPGLQGPHSCRSTAGTPRAAAHGHTGPDTSPGCCRGWSTRGNPGSAASQPFPARKIGKTSSKPPGWALGPAAATPRRAAPGLGPWSLWIAALMSQRNRKLT